MTGEIKTGDARSYALIQFDLHSFDQNILSFENSFLQVLRKDLIKSWNFLLFGFHFLHRVHYIC